MGDGVETTPPAPAPAANGKAANKRMSVERIYQKKTQLEHILLRPDTYIGSVQPVTEKMWVLDAATETIISKEITFVPGLYKIFDEILVNAADNKVRDPKMDTIKIDINPEKNEIKVFNNGKGIPVVHHKDENMYVPTMIFGHLLTSSNFNDEEEKVTGGRNGFGAKLCNVFSTKFTVETAYKESKKEFKQSWAGNMSKAAEPKIKEYPGSDYTRITFQPDLPKFNMERLDDDLISLLSRRAYDVAASTKGVKVYLNGKRIPIKNFKDYVDVFLKGHEDETGNQIKPIYELCSDRWEVAVAVSDNGFQQMSFVNSIATTKGGRHVDHVSTIIEKNLAETLKKKNKGGIVIKPHQIRNHLWLFVNCLIVNPTFDSQTKENMTLQVKQFGSSCKLSDKFIQQVVKCGVVESVLAWSKFKQDQQLKSKQTGKKTNKLKGIAKLEDANDAGTKNSLDCTLILTEGDSAKTLAVAGLGVVGRDKYGVYPLRGKLLNVREATHKQIMENKEINELVKIVGLQYKKKYLSTEDLKTLRYGRLMIMTDQDQDGSHIKGLLINFIHHNWPDLLRLPFLEEFITPIVKATKGTQSFSFYSLPEFSEWKTATENWHTYRIKYYKGLGTSTSKEAKEYFTDMARHRILFKHNSEQDDHAITMAFSKKHIEQRKDWLTNWMEEGKRRKELGLSEIYLYEKNTKAVSYQDFVNKELVLFSNLDNERSIPSIVDGFKPGQRKVMFTCLKRNDKREVKVAQLAGSVGEMSAYHHGEASLMGTIINLAQNYVGSNNINLLLPIGQFGTRLAGGKDAASPRYIFTMMSPLTRMIFNPHDDAILKYMLDDNQKIEPEWYMPIIPMVLVNGADGIGTGWMTKIPNYNPREIVKNLQRMLEGEEPRPMVPWFKGFRGTIEDLDHQRYVINGEISEISETKVEITELPVRTWTQTYKEQVMEVLSTGTDKVAAQIQDYKEYHTDTTVRFVVHLTPEKMRHAYDKGLHQFFKLQTTFTTSSMVLFDSNGCMKRYEDVTEIMREFFDLRLEFYFRRKKYLEGMLEAEALRLSNQARFILEKCDGSLVIENKKKKLMVAELIRKGFDPDPVKRWKAAQAKEEKEGAVSDDSDVGGDVEEDAKDADYDYLLGMAMWSLTAEKKEELLKKKDDKHKELDQLRRTTKEDLWRRDLKEFLEKLDEVEQKEKEDSVVGGGKKAAAAVGKGAKASGKKLIKEEVMPSPHGVRVAPKIPDELRKKAAQAIAAKDRKEGKVPSKRLSKEPNDKDEFDDMLDDKEMNRSLSERVGISKEVLKKQKTGGTKGAAGSKKKETKSPWDSDSASGSGSGSDSDMDMGSESVERRERDGVRRAAAAAAKSKFADSDKSDDSDDELNWKPTEAAGDSNNGSQESNFDSLLNSSPEKSNSSFSAVAAKKPAAAQPKKVAAAEKPKAKPAPKAAATKKTKEPWETSGGEDSVLDADTDDEDFSLASKKKKPITKKLDKAATSNLLDSSPEKQPAAAKKPAAQSKPAPKKKKEAWESTDDEDEDEKKPNFDDEDDSDFGVSKKKPVAEKPKPKAAAPPKRAAVFSDSDSDTGAAWKPSKALKTESNNGANGDGNESDEFDKIVDDEDSPIFGKKKAAAAKKPAAERKRPAAASGPKQPKEKKPKKEKVEKPKKAPAKPKAATKKSSKAVWESGSESGGAGADSGDDFVVEKEERDGIRRAAAVKSKYVDDSGSDSDMFG